MGLYEWIYILGWLCLAVGIACYNRNRTRGADICSGDIIQMMVLAGRKSKVTP